ncbi:MAG: hypothetical protein RJA76_1642 [Bacteroidota bacterium]|jgi:GNAT superfamily N-acetyltransferase
MKIRKANKEDIFSIQQIAEVTWRPTYLHIIGEEQCAYMLELMYQKEKLIQQMENGIQFFIAENTNKEPIGFAAFEKTEKEKGKLHKLYTHHFKKEKGTGSRLLETVITYATSNGVKTIELNVNRFNSAYEFYIKKGFKVAYEMDLEIGNGYFMNDYVMELELAN